MKVSQQASHDLQHNINTLLAITTSWGLSFAPNKCVHPCFKQSHVEEQGRYYLFGNVPTSSVSLHNNLGVLVDTMLRLHTHHQYNPQSW